MDAEGAERQEGLFCVVANGRSAESQEGDRPEPNRRATERRILRGRERGRSGIPVWNLRNTRNRLVNARGPTCTQGNRARCSESGASGGDGGFDVLA